jgi:hypothetical protein
MIPGMTLQDWFAGQVIAAMLGSDSSFASQRDDNGRLCAIEPTRLANIAKNAYQTAEAMMQARARAAGESG